MPCSVASDLGLHFLPMSHKKDLRHTWVNKYLHNFLAACDNKKLSATMFANNFEPDQTRQNCPA